MMNLPPFPIDKNAEKRRARKGMIEEEVAEILLPHMAPHLAIAFRVAKITGIRPKELTFVRLVQVDTVQRVIFLRAGETKNGDERVAPIPDILLRPLQDWMEWTRTHFPGCEWLIHYRGKRIGSWKKAWLAACRRAGLVRVKLNPDGTPQLSKEKRRDFGKPILEPTVKFYFTRKTATTEQKRAGVDAADRLITVGHRELELQVIHYDQDKAIASAQNANARLNAYHGKKNAAAPVAEIAPPPPHLPPATPRAVDITALKEIGMMFEKGWLTGPEFDKLKSQIII